MSAQHTHGPWKAARNSSFWEVVTPWPEQTLDEANEYSPSVAHVWGKTEQEAEERACLIAAAPDLLEALKRMELAFSPLARDCTLAGLIDEARAAIAKATGEQA